jgi:predicted secreted protein
LRSEIDERDLVVSSTIFSIYFLLIGQMTVACIDDIPEIAVAFVDEYCEGR